MSEIRNRTLRLMFSSYVVYVIIAMFVITSFLLVVLYGGIVEHFELDDDKFYSIRTFFELFMLLILVAADFLVLISLWDTVKDEYDTNYRIVYNNYMKELREKNREYVEYFYKTNDVFNKVIYVSPQLYTIAIFDYKFYKVELDNDRDGMSIGFTKKRDIIDKVEIFFEYE